MSNTETACWYCGHTNGHYPTCPIPPAAPEIRPVMPKPEWVRDHLADGTPLPEPFTHGDAIPKPTPKPDADVKTAIADEAKRIVSGARRAAYGKPEQNFERIARFWQSYFENTGRPEAKVTAADVSPLMRLMKEARLCETPDHRDSFVDLVGYTLTGAEVNGVKAT